MTCLRKWLNIAVVTIMLMTLVTPAVSAENNTDTTTGEQVVEGQLSELDESNEIIIDENTQDVISLINAIPSIEQLNETNHLIVQEARAAYEKLTDEQKQNVTNLKALVEKENALQALAKNVAAHQALNEVAEPEGYAYFSMEDFAKRGDGATSPEQLGIIIEREKVPFYEGDTIADVTVRAIEAKGITPEYGGDTKNGFYLSAIKNVPHNGKMIESFGEFSAGNMSGWMVSLNDWFINMGASEFLVTEGDTITWQYTGDLGADIGSDWTNTSAEITGLNIIGDTVQLSPAFNTAVKSYTLTVPEKTKTIQLKAESNKMSRVQYYVGNVEYKMLNEIPVNNGTVITIKSTFEDTMSGAKDADEQTIEVIFEQKDANVSADKTLLRAAITDAEANKATVVVSIDGKDIDPANFWVTQKELDAYVVAITEAQQLIADEAATQEVIDAKTLALNQTATAFKEAKKAGLKKVLPENDVEFNIAPKALTIKLYDEAGQSVDIGDGTAGTYKVYTTKLPEGNYQYEGFDANGKSVGGGQLTITDEPQQKYQFRQLNFKATNKDWAANNDYTVKVGQNSPTDTSLQFGELTSTGQVPVLALTNQTYFYQFEAHEKHEGYVPLSSSVTVTISTSAQTISGAIPVQSNVTFTVPEAATLFVGTKIKHFISFEEVKPVAEIVNENGTKTYSYKLANGATYNYRVSQPGKLTTTGTFKAEVTTALEITEEQLNAVSPTAILNKGTYLEGNIYLNINPQNHLSLNEGENFKLLPLRSWQALIEGVQNYFFEPDFHYEIITGNDVIAIEPGESGSYTTIKAVKNGTAIVKVSYDALKVNGSTYIKDANDAFSAIWPENVGLFVVTVGQGDANISTGIESNKERNVKANEKAIKNLQNGVFDADIDSVYFVEGERGAYYTFTPEENSVVTILRPQLNKELGTASYGDGTFTTDEVSKNEDGSFSVLLTEGRNIVKVEKDGKATYQVMTARPIGVTIDNVTNPGEPIVAGNKVKVKVDGISFPSNKLSGIYNFSGQLTFKDPDNKALAGKAIQYNLTTQGNELTFTIPEGHVGEYALYDGHIAIKGFGSAIGAHRDIDPLVGANPNFAAVSMESYYSIFPQITIISGQTEKADTATLQSTITEAEANKATVTVSTDGKDIDLASFWVTQTELDTYVAAITAAQTLIADEAATQEAIDAKTLALNQVTTALNKAKKAGAKSAEQLTTQLGYNTAAQYLVKLIPNPEFGSEWVILALARGGYEVPAGYYDTYYNNVVNHVQSVKGELHARKYTEYSRLVLALTAIGKDPRNVGGYNIVEKLYDFDKVVWQGINGAYFGLIALDTWGFELPENATTTRQKLVDHILKNQLADGGFALSGNKLDPDMTGMAIQALAPYYKEEKVKAAIDRAVGALASSQKENGGYASWGAEASESVAQVITALTSININPMQDERFIKTISNLLSFYSEADGGFKHVLSETKANGMATEQASYTLAAYTRLLNGQTALYNMLDTKPVTPGEEEKPAIPSEEEKKTTPDEEEKTITPGVEVPQQSNKVKLSIVISSSEVPLSTTDIEISEGDSVFDALKRAISLHDIPFSYRSTSYGIYIDGINDLYEFGRGPLSGWMYRVNGVFPSFSAALYTLQPGDRVEWLYTTDLGKDIGGYVEEIENSTPSDYDNTSPSNKEDSKNEATDALKDEQEVAKVISLINALPSVVVLNETNRLAIQTARQAYDALLDEQKASVKILDMLVQKENAFAKLLKINDVITEITGLVDVESVVWADNEAIQQVVEAYETLTAMEKSAVTNYDKLQALLDRIEQLKIAPTTEEKAYETVSNYMTSIVPNPTFENEWFIFSLARGGYAVPTSYYDTYYNNVVDYVKSVKGVLHERKYTEYSRLIMALTAIGKDPRNVGGYNIVEKLANFDDVVWQGVNGAYYGLIALDTWGFELSENATTTREKLIDHIISKQLADGGFALSGTSADPDMTAMAIQALAPYKSQSAVAQSIEHALAALVNLQGENGGYKSWGTENVESATQVATALISLGIDPAQDARFNKVIPNIMTYYNEADGGFKHIASQTKADGMATEQVGYTLAAYKRLLNGQTKLYDMSDTKSSVEDGSNNGGTDSKDGDQEETIKPPTEEKEPPKEGLAYGQTDFSIVISSSEVPLSTTPIEIFEGDSVFDALKRATSLYGIPLSYRSTSYGIYIDGIQGLYEFDRGPLSGWMYRVNGVFPAFSAALYTLQPGDRVEWLYTTDLGKDVGGYIEDIEKDPNEEKTDKDKQEEKDVTEEGLDTEKEKEKEQEAKTTVVTVDEAAEHLKAELTDKTIEQQLQDGVKKIVIQDKNGTKVELPTAALKLAEGEKAVVAVNQQVDGNVIDVTLAITSQNGSTKALVTGKDYAKITISAPTASANTVVLQSINGQYRAVPHKIVDGEIVLFVKSGGTFILSEEVVTFPDIAKLANKDDIEFLASRHVIKGTEAGTFAPNADITRAQFASMIARALGLQATEVGQFADTKGKWYEADVQALYEAGITTGVSVNAFNPNEKMTRQQAAAFMARVLAYVDFRATATKSSSFKDADSINAQYKQNIELLYSLDIMSGKEDGTFDAAGNLTRAQMAKILKRTLNTAGLM